MSNLNNAVAVLLITAIGFLVIGGALLINASDVYMTNFATMSLMVSAFLTIVAIAVQPHKK